MSFVRSPTMFAARDAVEPRAGRDCAADLYRQGITDPRRELDVAEIYVPFTWYEPIVDGEPRLCCYRCGLEDDRRWWRAALRPFIGV